MKSMMRKTTLREIKHSFGRYFAILAIVMLGVGFFAGLKVTRTEMIQTADEYLAEHDFFDYRLLTSMGFELSAPEEFLKLYAEKTGQNAGTQTTGQSELESAGTQSAEQSEVMNTGASTAIAAVQGAVSCGAIYTTADGYEGVLKFHSLTEGINELQLTAGRMPESADECVVDSLGFSGDIIGSTITISDKNDEDTTDLMSYSEYRVVGIAQSPLYLNFERGTTSLGNGRIDGFAYLVPEGFQNEYYTELYVKLADDRTIYADGGRKFYVKTTDDGMIYSASYKDSIKANEDIMEDVLHSLAMTRYESIREDALKKLDDAKEELADKKADGEQELLDARKKLDDARQELKDAEAEIAENKEKLADARVQIADGWKEIKDNETKVTDGLVQIDDGLVQIDDGIAQIDEALKKKPELLATHDDIVNKQAEVKGIIYDLENQKAGLEQKREELAGARTQYEGGVALLQSKKSELEGGLAAGLISQDIYHQSMQQIAAQEAVLQEQGKQLDAAQAELDAGSKALEDGLLQAKSGQSQLIAGMTQLNEGLAQIKEAEDKKAELLEQRNELLTGKNELNVAQEEIEKAKKELTEKEAEVVENEGKLADAEVEIQDAVKEIADGEKEYADGQKELKDKIAEAEEKIADAETDINELSEPDEYALTRDSNVGYVCFENDSSIVDGIADVFPLFFFLVAALVCITTMNRMIDEQRTQIGILKALGYSERKIMGNYLFYSGSAAITGCIIGFFAGSYVFPSVIWIVYGIMYGFAPITFVFDPVLATISLAVSMLCSMGTTWLSLRAELKGAAAELIRPKAPGSGKRIIFERITFFWKRLSFLQKVSVRNLFRYKKRFFMMIIGISGCTALLMAGFGIKDSIADIAAMQYGGIQINDATLTLSAEPSADEREAFGEAMSDCLTDEMLLMQSSVDMVTEDLQKSIYLMIPERTEDFGNYFNLYDKNPDEPLAFPGDGEVIITQKFAQKFSLKKGSEVCLRTGDMEEMNVTVSGICKNYVYNYVYMNRDTYRELLGKDADFNTMLVNLKEGTDIYAASARMMEQEPVTGVSLKEEISARFGKTLKSLDYIVLLVIFCAASLAFIVLYNLTNINICERIREIATIKVLGFYSNETAAYVFRENLVLTVIGALAGLILGKWLHAFIIDCIDIDLVFFDKIITVQSYCLSFGLTLIFAMVVNFIMRFRLEKINMAESLKSIE